MAAYTIMSAPAIFIITAVAFDYFRRRVMFGSRFVGTAIAYCFILLPVRYTIERVKPFEQVNVDPEWNRDIEEFAGSRYDAANTVVFNCPHYIEMMFKTKCICYETPPRCSNHESAKKCWILFINSKRP